MSDGGEDHIEYVLPRIHIKDYFSVRRQTNLIDPPSLLKIPSENHPESTYSSQLTH